MNSGIRRKITVFLWIALAAAIYLSIASVRLARMCEFWDYYNYPHLRYGSQITFAELVRYAMWLQRAPGYSWSSCLHELRQVDAAKQAWASDNKKSDDDEPTWKELKPYFGYADTNRPPPCCPYGGFYILGKVRDMPKCSLAGHAAPK